MTVISYVISLYVAPLLCINASLLQFKQISYLKHRDWMQHKTCRNPLPLLTCHVACVCVFVCLCVCMCTVWICCRCERCSQVLSVLPGQTDCDCPSNQQVCSYRYPLKVGHSTISLQDIGGNKSPKLLLLR